MRNLLLGMGFVCILMLVHQDFAKAQEASNAMKPMERTGLEATLQGLTVKSLRCEYRVDPLAIDEPAPRLSWMVESFRRAQRQTAYRILVADSLARLETGEGNMWDSGKVTSSRNVPASELAGGAFRCIPLQFEHPGGEVETRMSWSGDGWISLDWVAIWRVTGGAAKP